jgi:hypothetical protein
MPIRRTAESSGFKDFLDPGLRRDDGVDPAYRITKACAGLDPE